MHKWGEEELNPGRLCSYGQGNLNVLYAPFHLVTVVFSREDLGERNANGLVLTPSVFLMPLLIWSAFSQASSKRAKPCYCILYRAWCSVQKISNNPPRSNQFSFEWWTQMLSEITRKHHYHLAKCSLYLYKSHFPKIYE